MILQKLASEVTPEIIKDMMIPTIDSMASDTIPNIRFNVAKCYESMAPLMTTPDLVNVKNKILKPTLKRLNEDPDSDVRYYSSRALAVGKLLIN